MNYQLELRNYLNNIYNEKIYKILLNEDINKLKTMNLNDIKSLINSKEVYLGSDFDQYIISLIPKDFRGYSLRKSISKHHNITYPLLYNENGESLKDHNYTNFAKALWEDFTNETFISDLRNIFIDSEFYYYVNNNLNDILSDLIKKIEIEKSKNIIVIPYEKDNLINIVKDMIINKKLNFSYALSLVDTSKLREYMESIAIDLSFYDEFDKLEDDLEECLNKFFKYNNDELYDYLIYKENFTLIDNKLIKNI